MGLFWYPALNSKFDFDKPLDKGELLNSYIKYYLARLQSMFKYTGLPDSIPAKWLENYLLVNGNCAFVMDGDDLIVTTGGWGGIPDRYYIPTEYIVANPYVKESTRRTYTLGEDCVVMRNDTYVQGIMPLLIKYCSQMVENDITFNTADILSRAMLMITCVNDNDKQSVELWLKKLRRGELSAMGELPSMAGNQDRSINITPFQQVAGTLTDLIEYHQYLKAGLFNEIGLNSNYNMKREAINSNESQLNDDALHPLIDDMLRMRQEGLKEVNEMFGTNISVEFNSAWAENEKENELMLSGMEAQTEALETSVEEAAPQNDNGLIDDAGKGEEDGTDEDMGDSGLSAGDNAGVDDNSGRPELSTEEDEGEKGTGEEIEEPQAEPLAVDELTEAIEDLTEAIKNETKEGEA